MTPFSGRRPGKRQSLPCRKGAPAGAGSGGAQAQGLGLYFCRRPFEPVHWLLLRPAGFRNSILWSVWSLFYHGESLSLAAMMIDGGFASKCAAMTSSHFCTAERQYRMPVPYGSQRPPTAQWTATASGCTILARRERDRISPILPAARLWIKVLQTPTIWAQPWHLQPMTHSQPSSGTPAPGPDYDLVITGDLGELGHAIVRDFFAKDGIDMGRISRTVDCCSMTGTNRICTPEPPAAAALRRCSTGTS